MMILMKDFFDMLSFLTCQIQSTRRGVESPNAISDMALNGFLDWETENRSWSRNMETFVFVVFCLVC